MEKSYELQCLDYACAMTMQKGGQFNTQLHISTAIHHLLTRGYTNGFTSNEGARGYVEGLDSDKIEKELILNLVKQNACETRYGIRTMLGTNKTFDDDLTTQESCFLMYKMLKDGGIDSLKWILNKYPKLYSDLSSAFAETRYFNPKYGKDKLDDETSYGNVEQYLINQIEQHYSGYYEQQQGMNR